MCICDVFEWMGILFVLVVFVVVFVFREFVFLNFDNLFSIF